MTAAVVHDRPRRAHAGGGMLAFAAAHTAYFLPLAAVKLGWFLLHARPYYSDVHNVFTLLTLLPCYALAIPGARAGARPW